jgi:hypothetical protein
MALLVSNIKSMTRRVHYGFGQKKCISDCQKDSNKPFLLQKTDKMAKKISVDLGMILLQVLQYCPIPRARFAVPERSAIRQVSPTERTIDSTFWLVKRIYRNAIQNGPVDR